MNTNAIPPDIMADLQAVATAVAAGRKPDPELCRRVRERAEWVRQQVFDRHGVLDIGGPAIRALRDGEDE
jgi:hypothetical protein